MKLEGIIGKRADAPYHSGRSPNQIKLKCHQQQEFVVGGIARGSSGVDSLLLGVFEQGGTLRYVGSVPPYFRSRQAAAFLAHATPQDISPFRNTPKPERNREYLWLKSEIVVEVSFHEWTPRGELREAKSLALRHDKLAREVTVEPAIDPDRLSQTKAPVETVGRVMAAGSDLQRARVHAMRYRVLSPSFAPVGRHGI